MNRPPRIKWNAGRWITTPAEIAEQAAAAGFDQMQENSEWFEFFGRESGLKCVEYLRQGNPHRVAAAAALVDKIEAEVEIAAPAWVNRPAGAFPLVPEYLAGDPDCMRARVWEPNERAPVRVWVDISSSGSIAAADLEKRGTAAAALAMKLIQTGRPVELWTYTAAYGETNGRAVVACRLPLDPPHMGIICHCLASSRFSRGFCYELAYEAGFNGGWAKGYAAGSDYATRTASARARLLDGLCGPADIILPAPHARDAGGACLVFSDPVAWVREQVRICQEEPAHA